VKLLAILLALLTSSALADTRICGVNPERDAEGRIIRSTSLRNHFQRIHPCPSTGLTVGPCKGWAIDHVIPLACGGCDQIENMQWLKNSIKSCAGKECKDRWERKVYCTPMEIIK